MGFGRWLTAAVTPITEDLTPRVPTFTQTRPRASENLAVVNDWPAFGTTRRAAMGIPSVRTCRNLIVGAAVQMSLYRYRGGERITPAGTLLTQPDRDTTRSRTLASTIDDLLFHGHAYWLVLARDGISTERNPDGLPVRARWIPYTDVTPKLSPDAGSYSRLDGYDIAGIRQPVAPENVIRFDSALPGLLEPGTDASDAIAAAIEIEAAARRMAATELPAGVLENEGQEVSEAEAEVIVQNFQEKRRTRSVAFLQGMKYSREQLSAADLQLVEARALVATEMARLFNMPVSMISASPSGGASALLYSNLGSQLAIMVSSAVQPYLVTIEETLSLPAVTAQGNEVRFDTASFLRSDPADLADYATNLAKEQIISREEARGLLGIPAGDAPADLTPGTV